MWTYRKTEKAQSFKVYNCLSNSLSQNLIFLYGKRLMSYFVAKSPIFILAKHITLFMPILKGNADAFAQEIQWRQKLFGHLQILLLHNNYLMELFHNASYYMLLIP